VASALEWRNTSLGGSVGRQSSMDKRLQSSPFIDPLVWGVGNVMLRTREVWIATIRFAA
jgi:hypothetical protein